MHDHPTIKMENGKVKGSTAKADALSKKAKVGKEIHKKSDREGNRKSDFIGSGKTGNWMKVHKLDR